MRASSQAVSLAAHKREVVHFEATGFIDAAKSRPMSRDALFRLASCLRLCLRLTAAKITG